MSKPDLPICLDRLTIDDAEFLLELMQSPDYLQNVGDRGVRTLDRSINYIQNYFLASEKKHGFGYYVVKTRD